MTFEETVRAAVDRAVAELQSRLESELRMRADELVRAAEADRARAASEAAEAAATDARNHAAAELVRVRDRAAADIEALHHAALEETSRWERKLSDLKQITDAEIVALRQRAESEIAEVRRDAADRAAAAQQQLDTRIAELESRIAVEASRRADAEGRVGAIEAQIEVVRRQAEQAATDARRAEAMRSEALAESIRRIDGARSLAETLDLLLDAAGRELDRAALMVVRDGRLKGWRATGFRTLAQAQSIDVPLAEAGVLGDAIRTATPIVLHAGQPVDEQGRPSFGEDGDGHAVALPLIVGGVTVAVLYGEAGDAEPTAFGRCTAILEILTRLAARALEVVTMRQSIGLAVAPAVARGSHAISAAPAESSESREPRGDRSFLGSV